MDLTQTLVNALVLGAIGAVLTWIVHGVRKELQAFRTEVREEFRAVRTELREEISGVRGEIGGLRTEMREEIRAVRSDLTQVALAVGAKPRAENA